MSQSTEQKVVTYQQHEEFAKEAAQLARAGWRVVSHTDGVKSITVVYVRDGGMERK